MNFIRIKLYVIHYPRDPLKDTPGIPCGYSLFYKTFFFSFINKKKIRVLELVDRTNLSFVDIMSWTFKSFFG